MWARTPAKPWQGHVDGDLGVLGHQGTVGSVADRELVSQALGIGEVQALARAFGALGGQPLSLQAPGPEVQSLAAGDAPDDAVDHARARAARPGMGILKEGEVGAGSSCLVAVEQVIDAGIVLVHRLGHQAQSQDARVEVDVARRVGGDGGDVMNALELHPGPPM